MKMTNVLLIILIALIGFQKIPLKQEKTMQKIESKGIIFGEKYTKTKEVKAISKEKDNVKHSTSFRQYIDTNGNANERLSHNIRIGKKYYVSSGVYVRQNEYRNSAGVDFSIIKYW